MQCIYTCWLRVKPNDIPDADENTRRLHLSQERNVENEEPTSASPCPRSEQTTIAANGRRLGRWSQVGVEKWRETGARGGEGVGGAGVKMKIDLLRR